MSSLKKKKKKKEKKSNNKVKITVRMFSNIQQTTTLVN